MLINYSYFQASTNQESRAKHQTTSSKFQF